MVAELCPKTQPLRDYQREDIAAVYGEWEKGNNRTALVWATGLGKTNAAADIAIREVRSGGRVLFIANRTEPLDQMTERCELYAPDIRVGRVQARRNEITAPIVVASVQTIYRDKRLRQMLRPTVVIVDECQHAMAATFVKVLTWAGAFNAFDATRVVGLTATLVRSDGKGFGVLFQSVAAVRDIEWAVEHGWLARPVIVQVPLPSVKKNEGVASSIADEWMKYASDRITVAFTPNRESVRWLCQEFVDRGVVSEVVVGTTPPEDRKLTYKRLAAGDVRVMGAVLVPTEAWDCPPVACVLVARQTRSVGLYVQMVGRGLRLCAGKTDCVVLDVTSVRGREVVTPVDMYPTPVEIPERTW
jgi:superfamily II DNA or RNA helicase